jgi:peptide/nickel transport system substrate-binding protein
VLSRTAPRSIDPGAAGSQLEYEMAYATQRPLFAYEPGSTAPMPDLASGPAEVSPNARTVTVHLRGGVHFSPPVDSEVTSRDVAYAIQRGAEPSVRNPYFVRYFSNLIGARRASGGPIPGIVTPDAHTVVFRLVRPWGRELAAALALPLTAPVPAAVAHRWDRGGMSRYEDHLASTGPYMFATSRGGRVLGTGYVPGRSALLVRNPNWRPGSDFRPSYLDRVSFRFAGAPRAGGASVLSGSDVVENDPSLAAATLAQRRYGHQLSFSSYDGVSYVALDNSRRPFSNQSLRQALWAALDRQAMAEAVGSPLLASVASHFLYPGMPGSRSANELISPREMEFIDRPSGDPNLARVLIKTAGYASGTYTGKKAVSIVGMSGGASARIAQMTDQTLRKLGFKTHLRLVSEKQMQEECGTSDRHVDVCPNARLRPAFADPQALLYDAFDGTPASNPDTSENWAHVDNAELNSAMERESRPPVQALREEGFGAIDNALTRRAVGIPFAWTRGVAIEARDVHGVSDAWNGGAWDLSFSYVQAAGAGG